MEPHAVFTYFSAMMKRLAAAIVAAMLFTAPARAAGNVVVVELFTAQGCAVCNPANQLLGELADEPGVLALTWNVDVWNYLGWKDTRAAKSHTSRHEAYNAELADKSIATPQFVVNGRRLVTAAQKLNLLNAIQQSGMRGELPLNVTFLGAAGSFRARVAGPALDHAGTVYLVFTRAHETVTVAKGENAGRHLIFANTVVGFRALGAWSGGVAEFPIPLDEGRKAGADGVAVLVQDGEGGPLYGAAAAPLAGVRP
ncbi:MAG TPA: DUF1223 domain-containing protein [Sphingomonadales bacterium]|nr:DUF1223 domain-containing protein [Sphingomonadales bacterium]